MYVDSIILGIIQGLTEFLPISSSGHLVLAKWILGDNNPLLHEETFNSFMVILHFGTTLAVILYFIKTWANMTVRFFHTIKVRKFETNEDHLIFQIIVACIPAGIVGYLFGDIIEDHFRGPVPVIIMLIVFSGVMWVADHFSKKLNKMENMTYLHSLIIGLTQCIALIPGVSRSGMTISAALFLKYDRESSAKFSFLMSTPIIVGACVVKGVKVVNTLPSEVIMPFIVGTLASFIVGILSIHYLLKFIQKYSFDIFVFYRVILAVIIFILMMYGF